MTIEELLDKTRTKVSEAIDGDSAELAQDWAAVLEILTRAGERVMP